MCLEPGLVLKRNGDPGNDDDVSASNGWRRDDGLRWRRRCSGCTCDGLTWPAGLVEGIDAGLAGELEDLSHERGEEAVAACGCDCGVEQLIAFEPAITLLDVS